MIYNLYLKNIMIQNKRFSFSLLRCREHLRKLPRGEMPYTKNLATRLILFFFLYCWLRTSTCLPNCWRCYIFLRNGVAEVQNVFSSLQVGWPSNNHGGGFVRISLVPVNQHQDEAVALNNVLKFVCYGHDTRSGRTRFGDCKHPCDAREGCDYPQSTFIVRH